MHAKLGVVGVAEYVEKEGSVNGLLMLLSTLTFCACDFFGRTISYFPFSCVTYFYVVEARQIVGISVS